MRFLIREMPYEQRLAWGEYRQYAGGVATGLVENWRLNRADDELSVLRIDHDGRASGGDSFLLHALIARGNRLERVKYRTWHNELEFEGDLIFEDGLVIETTRDRSATTTNEHRLVGETRFVCTCAAGFGLAFRNSLPDGTIDALILEPFARSGASQTTLSIAASGTETESLAGSERQLAGYDLAWSGRSARLMVDDDRWPMTLRGPGNQELKAAQYVHYGERQ